PFDEDVAVGRFDKALPAEIAFDAAPRDLPDAGDDRRGAGVGDPGLERFRDEFVQVGLPQLLALEGELENRAIRPGREELVAARGKTNQGWAAELWSFFPFAANEPAVPDAGDASLVIGSDVGKSPWLGHRADLPGRNRESVERVG